MASKVFLQTQNEYIHKQNMKVYIMPSHSTRSVYLHSHSVHENTDATRAVTCHISR